MENRIYGKKVKINIENINEFFKERSERYNEETPLTVILYQDNNPELAVERDKYEKSFILPKLSLKESDRVLDIGCGIGRWAEPLVGKVKLYDGVDLDEGLIEIAKKKYQDHPEFTFICSNVQEFLNNKISTTKKYEKIILAGVLQYLNDDDLEILIKSLAELSADNALIYIRSTISLTERLTLNNVWSEELKQHYSSIYRTDEEHLSFYKPLLENGFSLKLHTRLYPDHLNNRSETTQFVYLIERVG